MSRDVKRAAIRLADLDHLPFGLTSEDVLALLEASPGIPTAVHGYNLDRDSRRRLRRLKVRIFRRLTRTKVTSLVAGVDAARAERTTRP
jgi:hypothetical protein